MGVYELSVKNWLKRFSLNGLEGLKEQKGRGVKKKLPDEKQQAFREAILELQANRLGYAYIFGAVCPARDLAVGLVMPAVNSEAMKTHLEHIAAQVPEGKHGVIVLDRAAWHTTKKLKIFPHYFYAITISLTRAQSNRTDMATIER